MKRYSIGAALSLLVCGGCSAADEGVGDVEVVGSTESALISSGPTIYNSSNPPLSMNGGKRCPPGDILVGIDLANNSHIACSLAAPGIFGTGTESITIVNRGANGVASCPTAWNGQPTSVAIGWRNDVYPPDPNNPAALFCRTLNSGALNLGVPGTPAASVTNTTQLDTELAHKPHYYAAGTVNEIGGCTNGWGMVEIARRKVSPLTWATNFHTCANGP